MRLVSRFILPALVLGLCSASYYTILASAEEASEPALKSFAKLQPIDVHVHVFKHDPAFQAMLERRHLKLLNILVEDDTLSYRKHLQPQIDDALSLVRSSRGHVAWCTTFDPYKFNDATFADDAVKQLDQNFSEGAITVKIWKNIGLEIKNASGKYVMPDDPKFEPIYQDIENRGKTLMTHVAEPDIAWGPPDPSDPTWPYYQENPQWFMYQRPDFPSKQEILAARDHLLALHPKLRVVGVHLGSMEKDIDNIARHLDKYPNFAVDTAARMEYLMLAPAEKVKAFLIKYQDRVIYGTDLDLIATADANEAVRDWEATYLRDWKFFSSDETFDLKERRVRGLKLPMPVLRKIYRSNAKHWVPGL